MLTFVAIRFWAAIERQEEHEANRQYIEERGPLTVGKVLKNRFSKGVHQEKAEKEKAEDAKAQTQSEGSDKGVVTKPSFGSSVNDEEWKTAARSLRTASWGTIFYLITADILGWSTCP